MGKLVQFMKKAIGLRPLAVQSPTTIASVIRESYPGAWQQNVELTTDDQAAYWAVFACMTLIAGDMSKLDFARRRLQNGVWVPSEQNANTFAGKVLTRPNVYQTWAQFCEYWINSKLRHGNTFVWKERDGGGRVTALHILSPRSVFPLVSPSGLVFYQLGGSEMLAEGRIVDEDRVVPASEIMHDRFNCLFHPLVGVSPLWAAALAVSQGVFIQNQSITQFQNNSVPGGILAVPGNIDETVAGKLRDQWAANQAGMRRGSIAVLTNGMKYDPMQVTATDSQLIEQLTWTAQAICAIFHVPPWKIGFGPEPSSRQQATTDYYKDCLQRLINDFQQVFNDGLDVPSNEQYRFDTASLLMLDPNARMDTLRAGVDAGIVMPNEARQDLGLLPAAGGSTLWKQQQEYPLDVLARIHAAEATAAENPPAVTPTPPVPEPEPEDQARGMTEADVAHLSQFFLKALTQ